MLLVLGSAIGAALYFANVTEFGDKAKDWIATEGHNYAAVGLVETHATQKKVDTFRRHLAKIGYKSAWCPAVETKNDDKDTQVGPEASNKVKGHGGSVVLAPKHKSCDFALVAGNKVLTQGCKGLASIEATDFSFVFVHLKGMVLAFVVFYMDVGGPNSAANQAKVAKLASFLQMLGIMYVLAADWNCTTSELAASGLPRMLGAKVVVPTGASYSCTSGSHRLIDFVLLGNGAEEMVSEVEFDFKAFW